jgi:DNA-directed RNA polymerase alpha subunit
MELVASGWGRDHGEKVIARRDLTEARASSSSLYSRPEVYINTTEGKEAWPFGVRAVENGNIELRFYAKITLNGEYLVRQTMSRKEITKLFLSLYDSCSFQELFDIINEVKGIRPNGDFPPIMLKHVKDIGISNETAAYLIKSNLWQVGQLVQKTEAELRSLPGYIDNSIFEIKDQLMPLGLQFGMQIHGWPAVPSFLFRKLDEFELSIRTSSCLKNDNLVYLGDLVKRTEAEMSRVPNISRKVLDEIKEAVLKPLDLRFGMEFPGWRSPTT